MEVPQCHTTHHLLSRVHAHRQKDRGRARSVIGGQETSYRRAVIGASHAHSDVFRRQLIGRRMDMDGGRGMKSLTCLGFES